MCLCMDSAPIRVESSISFCDVVAGIGGDKQKVQTAGRILNSENDDFSISNEGFFVFFLEAKWAFPLGAYAAFVLG